MIGLTNKTFTCPFYSSSERRKRDKRRVVHCECGSRVVFPDRRAFEEYTDRRCAGEWEQCSIAKLLTKYYEERDDEQKTERRGAGE